MLGFSGPKIINSNFQFSFALEFFLNLCSPVYKLILFGQFSGKQSWSWCPWKKNYSVKSCWKWGNTIFQSGGHPFYTMLKIRILSMSSRFPAFFSRHFLALCYVIKSDIMNFQIFEDWQPKMCCTHILGRSRWPFLNRCAKLTTYFCIIKSE